MTPLLTVLPFCAKDAKDAIRLLEWIRELDTQILGHSLLLIADDAVPAEVKAQVKAVAVEAFRTVSASTVKCPAPVNNNYHVPAAVMFDGAAFIVDSRYKWNWLWLEPDAVPLKSGWLDRLAEAYDESDKRFMGVLHKHGQKDLPETVMYGTAVYPNCARSELKKFCDGTKPFDMAFSDYVVPRATHTNLIHHRFGSQTESPTFKDAKLPTDGPNVGTLNDIPKEAVLFHRCKDGSLIQLIRNRVGKQFVKK